MPSKQLGFKPCLEDFNYPSVIKDFCFSRAGGGVEMTFFELQLSLEYNFHNPVDTANAPNFTLGVFWIFSWGTFVCIPTPKSKVQGFGFKV